MSNNIDRGSEQHWSSVSLNILSPSTSHSLFDSFFSIVIFIADVTGPTSSLGYPTIPQALPLIRDAVLVAWVMTMGRGTYGAFLVFKLPSLSTYSMT